MEKDYYGANIHSSIEKPFHSNPHVCSHNFLSNNPTDIIPHDDTINNKSFYLIIKFFNDIDIKFIQTICSI